MRRYPPPKICYPAQGAYLRHTVAYDHHPAQNNTEFHFPIFRALRSERTAARVGHNHPGPRKKNWYNGRWPQQRPPWLVHGVSNASSLSLFTSKVVVSGTCFSMLFLKEVRWTRFAGEVVLPFLMFLGFSVSWNVAFMKSLFFLSRLPFLGVSNGRSAI